MTAELLANIVRCVREHNAAQNSLRRAIGELTEAVPANMIVLCAERADDDVCRVVYGPRHGGATMSEGVERASEVDMTMAIKIVVPHPRLEFLPRLDQQ